MDDSNIEEAKNKLTNLAWLADNEGALKNMFPEEWTSVKNVDGLKMAYALKLLGIDWRTEEEYAQIMAYLSNLEIYLSDVKTPIQNTMIKRNPEDLFRTLH